MKIFLRDLREIAPNGARHEGSGRKTKSKSDFYGKQCLAKGGLNSISPPF
ncbi:MAG: hypothetical protein ACP5VS_05220 [Desulfomonilaceae bacterium]